MRLLHTRDAGSELRAAAEQSAPVRSRDPPRAIRHYCRCTGYKKIVEAVLDAATRLPAEASA
jgi:aerobic-type carbon monoxide dehydrogenase small subunit (CoxS/CutS family)